MKEAPGRTRYFAAGELDLLLNGRTETVKASDGRTWTVQHPHPDLRIYIISALQTGGRRGELLNLRWADIDMRTKTLSFKQTKNGDSRTVLLTATLLAALQSLPRPLDPDAFVLPRRSPQALSRAFGHKDPRMSVRYHHITPEHLHDAARALDTRPRMSRIPTGII